MYRVLPLFCLNESLDRAPIVIQLPTMLCALCNGMFAEPGFSRRSSFPQNASGVRLYYETAEMHVHHPDLSSLKASLEAGCEICNRLLASMNDGSSHGVMIDSQPVQEVDASTFSTQYRFAVETQDSSLISLFYVARAQKAGKWVHQKRTEYLFLAGDQQPVQSAYEPSDVNGLQSSSMDVLAEWLSLCCANHQSCAKRPEPRRSRRYARIVDVGASLDDTCVKVCAAEDMIEDSKYTTLSHRWGGAHIPSLTIDNQMEYSRGIKLTALPQVFQDAIKVTRVLNVKYIWIDSLCIIQDSEQDWLKEAELMGEIYRGSYLNISAADAGTSHGSLFVHRNRHTIKSARVALKGVRDHAEGSWYDFGADWYLRWGREITQAGLNKRGWVIQERVLAPRVIHFAKNQLFWECLESRLCEEAPHTVIDTSIPSAVSAMVDFKTLDPFVSALAESPSRKLVSESYMRSSLLAMRGVDTAGLDTDEVRSQYRTYGDPDWELTHPLLQYWSKMLRIYSMSKLTFAKDRLIAISGLARILSEQSGVPYVCGLWGHQLPRQLLWGFLGLHSSEKEDYIAPSWSWASKNGPVELYGIHAQPNTEEGGGMDLVKVLSLTVNGLDPRASLGVFGTVKSATLRIRGRLLPISLDPSQWPSGAFRKDRLVQFWHGTTKEYPVGETFLLPMLYMCWEKEVSKPAANCMIIESTEEKGVFRRVGRARVSRICSLVDVTPSLYMARSTPEEETEDASANNERLVSTPSRTKEPPARTKSPYEHLHDARQQMIESDITSQSIGRLETGLRKQPPGKVSAGTAKVMSGLANAIKHIKARTDLRGDGEPVRAAATQADEGTARPVHKLSPRDAIAPHFYLECLDDEDVARYGHFVFEII